MQDHTGISNVAPEDAPLRSLPILEGSDNRTEAAGAIAEAKLHDYINGLQFCISPTAFFQVRTLLLTFSFSYHYPPLFSQIRWNT